MEPRKPKITPEQLNLFTEPVTDIYRALEDEIFRRVAKRLKTNPKHGKDYVLQWQVEKMQELRILNKETVKELAKATGKSEEAIRKAIEDVGHGTIRSIDEELKGVYEPLPMPNQINTILESYVNQTFREIDNLVNQTLISTNYGEGTVARMYRKIVEETTGKVLAGATTTNKAIAETVIKWSNKGIDTAFVDKGGHVWTLERYSDAVVRSTVNRTYNDLRTSRMDEYGVDLVLVSTVPDPREACSHIQGNVASMNEPAANDSKYPSIYDFGYGEPSGLRGIHCRHLFYPYIEGLSENHQKQYSESEMEKNRDLSSKQRYYERQIRKAKRSLNLAEEIGDTETIQKYKKLVRNRQAKVREFVKENDLPRMYNREQVYT